MNWNKVIENSSYADLIGKYLRINEEIYKIKDLIYSNNQRTYFYEIEHFKNEVDKNYINCDALLVYLDNQLSGYSIVDDKEAVAMLI